MKDEKVLFYKVKKYLSVGAELEWSRSGAEPE
jgi:hypothetical protein